MAADAYAAMQREILSSARVEDNETSPEVLRAVRLVLDRNTSSLDDAELVAVLEYLRRDSSADDGPLLLPRGTAPVETRELLEMTNDSATPTPPDADRSNRPERE